MNIKVKKVVGLNGDEIVKIGKWMYNWWGEKAGYTLDEVVVRIQHSLCEDRIPQTFIAKKENRIIGIYQFAMDDAPTRPDLYPWLCNFYVDEDYRNFGVAKAMLKSVKENMEALNINQIYLYTEHTDLFEKYGFVYQEEIIVDNAPAHLYMLKI